jgi:methionyl-tRNA formyltransferase
MTFRFSTYAKGLKPYNVLFFGSDEFSTICLQTMLQRSNMIRNVEVVLPYHMNQPLRTFAISNYLEIHRAPAHGESWKNWKVPEFDIGVVVSFVILILIIGFD